jgi:hypothetical protein
LKLFSNLISPYDKIYNQCYLRIDETFFLVRLGWRILYWLLKYLHIVHVIPNIICKYIYMNKINIMCNQLIGYRVYTLTLSQNEITNCGLPIHCFNCCLNQAYSFIDAIFSAYKILYTFLPLLKPSSSSSSPQHDKTFSFLCYILTKVTFEERNSFIHFLVSSCFFVFLFH